MSARLVMCDPISDFKWNRKKTSNHATQTTSILRVDTWVDPYHKVSGTAPGAVCVLGSLVQKRWLAPTRSQNQYAETIRNLIGLVIQRSLVFPYAT
ncbi:hypothetical protein Pan241w_60450 [Gimesia alba]|uniref:Uncharacterized protein n=1 Tax=Gimesia alba TaxID=2527973 RepID=A0A517RPX9_9PLAN|nr:hypothetical protein [Gimesia alba]QDT45917.1 hypothetical protein Pan241w_60450 [Gimesia alba]